MTKLLSANVKITYFGKNDVNAEIVSWRYVSRVTLTLDAVPPFIRKSLNKVAYDFFGKTALTIYLFRAAIPDDRGLVAIVKTHNGGIEVEKSWVFDSPDKIQDYAQQMIQAGYDAIKQALTQIPAYIPNPIVPPLEAIAATSVKR